MKFEPYVIVPKSLCPKYDERYSGFGWNKISHIMELDAAGFTFTVLPYGFIMHVPHLGSTDEHKFHNSRIYRNCIEKVKSDFFDDLMAKYNLSKDHYGELPIKFFPIKN